MRTTIDLPEELLRQTKAVAAFRGMKMKDLVEEFVRSGLGQSSRKNRTEPGMKCSIPVTIPADGRNIPPLTNAHIFDILEAEDDLRHDRLS